MNGNEMLTSVPLFLSLIRYIFFASIKPKVHRDSSPFHKYTQLLALKMKGGHRSGLQTVLCPLFPVGSLNSLLIREWPFSKGAPIVYANLCPNVHWKPLFTYTATNVSVGGCEYVWSARCPLIQVKRHDTVQQRAPLENTVMQIAFPDIFPVLDKEKSGSPKVSSFRTGKQS